MNKYVKYSRKLNGMSVNGHARRAATKMASVSPLLLALSFIAPVHVAAAPPYQADLVQGGNKWLLDAYDDTDADHNLLTTQGVCFEYAGTQGSHQQYTWYSDSFLGWRGTASQEGDQIFLHGMYANGKGHDAVQLRIIIDAPRSGTVGHWQEWREDGEYGRTIGFANARMIRSGDCTLTANEAQGTGGTFPFPIPIPSTNDNPMTFK